MAIKSNQIMFISGSHALTSHNKQEAKMK